MSEAQNPQPSAIKLLKRRKESLFAEVEEAHDEILRLSSMIDEWRLRITHAQAERANIDAALTILEAAQ